MPTPYALPPGFDRFAFTSDALDAVGGFAPRVKVTKDENGLFKSYMVDGPCYLVPYPRESMSKFSSRAQVAVYENHLAAACERFVSHLVKKPPTRTGTDGPASAAFVDDADWCGNSLDTFWSSFMVQARARGTMLVLVDMPEQIPVTAAEQIAHRAVPYLTAIRPERVRGYDLDDHGKITRLAIAVTEMVAGEPRAMIREWDAKTWRVIDGDKIVRQGEHSFGRCPIALYTETNIFPCFGAFEQIARLSLRHYNAQSELDEILRSQTFSLLTYQVPPESAATFNAADTAATIGTHNMLVHQGDVPSFIAPADGPAQVYMSRIAALETSIRRIGMGVDDTSQQAAESGLALQLRFQSLNSALSNFASRMQDLERQVWDLFAAGMGTDNRVLVQWSLDYSLANTVAELDVLTAMQSTGFPDRVLAEQRKAITAAVFANVEPHTLDELMAAIDEPAQAVIPPAPVDLANPIP
jgi:hypothetical protein